MNNKSNRLLSLWQRTSVNPGGKQVFSRLVCIDVPWFAAIRPSVNILQPGHAEVTMHKRQKVLDHNGNVHAMATCSLAELTAYLLVRATIPATHDAELRAVTAEYLHNATTDLIAVARAHLAIDAAKPTDHQLQVEVRNTNGTLTSRVEVRLRASPKLPGSRGTPLRHEPSPGPHGPVFQA